MPRHVLEDLGVLEGSTCGGDRHWLHLTNLLDRDLGPGLLALPLAAETVSA